MTNHLHYHPHHAVAEGQVYEIRRGVPYHWRVLHVGDDGRVTLYFDGKQKTISRRTLRKDYWLVERVSA